MFELPLAELFNTISLGILMLIILVYFRFQLLRLFNRRKHNGQKFSIWFYKQLKNQGSIGLTTVVTMLILVVGMLTEDITEHMADSDENSNFFFGFIRKKEIIKSESTLRAGILFNKEKGLTPLGTAVFQTHYQIADAAERKQLAFLRANDTSHAQNKISKKLCLDENNIVKLKSLVNENYYRAKNWCYLNSDAAHKELESIQRRIDFSRSVCLVSFCTLLGVLLLYSVYYIREHARGKKGFRIVVRNAQQRLLIRRQVFYPEWLLLLFTIAIYYIAHLSYEAEEWNFNARVFGYYTTHAELEAEKIAAGKPADTTASGSNPK